MRTHSPEHHLDFVRSKRHVTRCGQTGLITDHPVDVLGAATLPAHQVMVVIADPPLKARRMAGRLDPPQQARPRAGVENVIDGLGRYRAEPVPHAGAHLLDGGMRVLIQPYEHCAPRGCHPQARGTQKAGRHIQGGCGRFGHPPTTFPPRHVRLVP